MAHDGSGPGRLGRLAGLRGPRWGEPVGFLFIAPAIMLYLLFNAYPIVRTVAMSFQHFVWTDPNHVTMKTIDSNTWGGRSGHVYDITRNPDGTTDVDATVFRDGKNFKGRAIGGVLTVFGKRVLGKELQKTTKAIEARDYEAGPTL